MFRIIQDLKKEIEDNQKVESFEINKENINKQEKSVTPILSKIKTIEKEATANYLWQKWNQKMKTAFPTTKFDYKNVYYKRNKPADLTNN